MNNIWNYEKIENKEDKKISGFNWNNFCLVILNFFFFFLKPMINILSFFLVIFFLGLIFKSKINKSFELKRGNIDIEWKKGENLKKENLDVWLKEEINITGEFADEIKKLIKKEILKINFFESDSFGSIIFSGETGTGKTFLSEKLASSFSSHYINLPSSHFVSKWSGEQTENIVKLEKEVLKRDKLNRDNKMEGPIILVIDEIETLLLKKNLAGINSDSPITSENAKVTNAFQTFCDKLQKDKINVRIIGTTNYINFIEEASLRRLGSNKKIEKIEVNLDFISNFLVNFLRKIEKVKKIKLDNEEYENNEIKIREKKEIIIKRLNEIAERVIREKGNNIKKFKFSILKSISIKIKMSSLIENIKESIIRYLEIKKIDPEEKNLEIILEIRDFLNILIDNIEINIDNI